ncbi:MAG: hypothetical protein SGI92_22440 [Bryobacteraceae bacterium]|nr:hypothetical protein [Bryobacteraceae bacterium]
MRTYFFAGLLALSLTACSTAPQTEARTETDQTRARVDNARESYQKGMQDRLDRVDREIDEERAKAEGRKMNAKAKKAYAARMDDLRKMRTESREKYNEMKNSTENGWERFKDGLDSTADKLDRAWDNFKADMKS